MDLSRIPAQPELGLINVVVEIAGGSKNKYEFDKDMNAFILASILVFEHINTFIILKDKRLTKKEIIAKSNE